MHNIEKVNNPLFIPQAFLVDGEYFVYRLREDGQDLIPTLERVSESVLKSFYNVTELEKLVIKYYAGFKLFPETDHEADDRDIYCGIGLTHFNLFKLPLIW